MGNLGPGAVAGRDFGAGPLCTVLVRWGGGPLPFYWIHRSERKWYDGVEFEGWNMWTKINAS